MFNTIRASLKVVTNVLPKNCCNIYQNIPRVPICLLNPVLNNISVAPHTHKYGTWSSAPTASKSLLSVVNPFTPQSSRSVIKFSLKKGKRKSCKQVLKRFYRLDWGVWIRTKCGRAKKLYKKSANRKIRLRQHVFTNGTQSWLLDKLVTNYWRRPRFYVDDPYEPYHSREEFPISRRKPFIPSDK